MATINVVTGITVERKLFTFPKGTFVGAPVCSTDPTDCCTESGSGSGSGAIRDVAAGCTVLSGYLFPRTVYLTVAVHPACGTPSCPPGSTFSADCQTLAGSPIPLVWDSGTSSWRTTDGVGGFTYTVGTCSATLTVAWTNVVSPDGCLLLSGFFASSVYPFYTENINQSGFNYTVQSNTIVPYPFYAAFSVDNIQDCGFCGGLYYLTE